MRPPEPRGWAYAIVRDGSETYWACFFVCCGWWCLLAGLPQVRWCCRSWTGSGYASCFSESVGHAGGDPRCDVFNAVVASIVGGCPAMEETNQRNSNHSKRKEVQGRQESPQPGFDLLVGFPFPLGFFFRILVFFAFFFVQGGVPAPQEPMEKLSSTGRSALDPFKHGCVYTGQPPDVPMALCFLSGCRLHWHAIASRC